MNNDRFQPPYGSIWVTYISLHIISHFRKLFLSFFVFLTSESYLVNKYRSRLSEEFYIVLSVTGIVRVANGYILEILKERSRLSGRWGGYLSKRPSRKCLHLTHATFRTFCFAPLRWPKAWHRLGNFLKYPLGPNSCRFSDMF